MREEDTVEFSSMENWKVAVVREVYAGGPEVMRVSTEYLEDRVHAKQ